MEKEMHVDNISSDKQTDICQILFDIVEDQSEVYRQLKQPPLAYHKVTSGG